MAQAAVVTVLRRAARARSVSTASAAASRAVGDPWAMEEQPDSRTVVSEDDPWDYLRRDVVRVWRLADGTPVGEPIISDDGVVSAVAVGALSDGTPVIVSGHDFHGDNPGTLRVWRLADGTPVGEPIISDDGAVSAVAVGALPDGTPIIVSRHGRYGSEGTVRVWRLADGVPVVPPLALPESGWALAVHGDVIVTAAGADIAVHQPALPEPALRESAAVLFPEQ